MNTVQCTIRIYLLQQRLTNDEVLALLRVYNWCVFGEFGNDGVDATLVTGTPQSNQAIITQSLVLKC
jgi:hypothetical protein